ncbi:type VII secretion-associated protein (TIGR03931 family) [Nocardia tenerifensis]|uniref:Type VII secretion-associated protein (TIGR03931 family) n=1 Tax=Nocardia tenerifensis TaxID=228006 RepID=A0A318K963_9NOCA|nr:type VII secretion-associated protein [Nocardia tenerifensis]PXX66536.1 type VII secretion-associated protein (TIGR03931 family) [Nocardia tenerifensis]
MPTVELVVTDTRVWARGATTHWDAPPSIVLGSNGFDLVVGEPLNPPTQVSSAVQYVPAEAVALLPRLPSIVDALTAVFAAVLGNLRVAAPCERITLICPTEWGASRRSVLDQAARRFTADVVFEELAVRAVTADEGTSHSHRTLVLEFGALTTTASTVLRSHEGAHVESCEHQPALALAEVLPESRGFADLCALIDRVLDGRPADLAQCVGITDAGTLDLLRAAVRQRCGPGVALRALAGPDLIRGQQTEPIRQAELPAVLPQTEWMQPLRERAAAQQPRRGGLGYVGAAVAALLVVAGAVVGGVVLLNRSDDTAATGPAVTSVPGEPVPSGETGTSVAPSSSPASPAQETFGRIRFQVPDGWHVASTPDTSGRSRVDLSPDDGARLRVTVTQTPVAPGATYEQVATKLESQMNQRPAGVMSELKRDVVYGGRSTLAYTERPGDGSTVRWHVLLEYGIQVSVGCQYADNDWQSLSTTCENFGSSVRVIQ